MTRMFSAAVLITALGAATAAGAQTPDLRWNDWIGCWSLVADANVTRLPPAEDAAGGLTDPIRRGSSRDASICVAPREGGAELRTLVGGLPVLTQTIIADGADHRVNDGGCTGTQRAQWSSDGLRLFTSAQVTCDNQPPRTVTGLALMAPDGQWVDVQAVTIDGRDSVRVRRFRPPAQRALKGVPAAAVRLQIDDVKEASKLVSPRAVEAALIETSARFPLSSKVLVDLDKSGVDDGVIDLMVALSYPRSFAIRPSGPDDRLTAYPPLMAGADFFDAGVENPFFYGPYYSNYYYSPYFFSPFGYSYLRYYPQFYVYAPGAIIIPGEGGGGGGSDHNLPPERGRVVNGLGYTRVDRRDAIGSGGDGGGGGAASARSGGSRGTVSPRGYSAGDSGSSSSSSGGGGSSSGGSSGGSSSGSSGGDGGRTAVPK